MKINIYITEAEKEKINDIRNKYHVSLSTIIDKLVFYTYKAVQENKEVLKKIQEEYIYKNEANTKTSCCPRCFNKGNIMRDLITKKDRFATNCIKIYLNKEMKNYTTEENAKKFYSEINKQLQMAKEKYWDYNNFIRQEVRMLKYNKKYLKRKLEELE